MSPTDKHWQHEETGRTVRCEVRPSERWFEISHVMTDKELYYILCPDGCWHEWYSQEGAFIQYLDPPCEKCGKHAEINPDFTTWDGLGVMITEGQKRDWWKEFRIFLFFLTGHLIVSRIPDDTVPVEYLNPPKFRDALKKFHKEKP